MSIEKLDEAFVEQTREEKIKKAKELYSHGSRNYLVKSYSEAADELSQVCALYEELYGELSDELGMPYLLYAKSLIALALDENKVISVPDEEELDDEDDDDEEEEIDGDELLAADQRASSSSAATNGTLKPEENEEKKPLTTIKEDSVNSDQQASSVNTKIEKKQQTDEADSTEETEKTNVSSNKQEKTDDKMETEVESSNEKKDPKVSEEAVVTSTEDTVKNPSSITNGTNGTASKVGDAVSSVDIVMDDEKPSTSNGDVETAEDDDENDVASSLQLAWEILELAAKIFSRQGISGLANLAEVQTELANIEFENNILDAAREDYERALKIYKELSANYRRAMAEIHYKIGLTFLMQQMNPEGANSLKDACSLIEGEIEEMRSKENPTDKDKENIQDMEETKQEIWAKIAEIEETRQQNITEVRAALDSFICPGGKDKAGAEVGDGAGPSSSTCTSASTVVVGTPAPSSSLPAITSSSKPSDISHLIKRKKPDSPLDSEAEAASPAKKRPAV